eukprot:CAMPEP_0175133616 /NCGR_PEP_ID=MMETSP0087-20121206/7744_1 /TAXON_ID=136419 /ORGANISM="Unknown Unknown, Strain D1" /LENGTH=1196 /DNA_ID=CAMNT_0016416131 /DNA_START=69 /DNA_END=3659 /DNA_ORIENTATION=-
MSSATSSSNSNPTTTAAINSDALQGYLEQEQQFDYTGWQDGDDESSYMLSPTGDTENRKLERQAYNGYHNYLESQTVPDTDLQYVDYLSEDDDFDGVVESDEEKQEHSKTNEANSNPETFRFSNENYLDYQKFAAYQNGKHDPLTTLSMLSLPEELKTPDGPAAEYAQPEAVEPSPPPKPATVQSTARSRLATVSSQDSKVVAIASSMSPVKSSPEKAAKDSPACSPGNIPSQATSALNIVQALHSKFLMGEEVEEGEFLTPVDEEAVWQNLEMSAFLGIASPDNKSARPSSVMPKSPYSQKKVSGAKKKQSNSANNANPAKIASSVQDFYGEYAADECEASAGEEPSPGMSLYHRGLQLLKTRAAAAARAKSKAERISMQAATPRINAKSQAIVADLKAGQNRQRSFMASATTTTSSSSSTTTTATTTTTTTATTTASSGANKNGSVAQEVSNRLHSYKRIYDNNRKLTQQRFHDSERQRLLDLSYCKRKKAKAEAENTDVTAGEEPKENVGDRLYTKGVAFKQKIEKEIHEVRANTCSFQPKLNPNSRKIAARALQRPNSNPRTRNQEAEEVSFTPKINSKSRKLAAQRRMLKPKPSATSSSSSSSSSSSASSAFSASSASSASSSSSVCATSKAAANSYTPVVVANHNWTKELRTFDKKEDFRVGPTKFCHSAVSNRLLDWKDRRDQTREQRVAAKSSVETDGCTFKPNLDKRSEILVTRQRSQLSCQKDRKDNDRALAATQSSITSYLEKQERVRQEQAQAHQSFADGKKWTRATTVPKPFNLLSEKRAKGEAYISPRKAKPRDFNARSCRSVGRPLHQRFAEGSYFYKYNAPEQEQPSMPAVLGETPGVASPVDGASNAAASPTSHHSATNRVFVATSHCLQEWREQQKPQVEQTVEVATNLLKTTHQTAAGAEVFAAAAAVPPTASPQPHTAPVNNTPSTQAAKGVLTPVSLSPVSPLASDGEAGKAYGAARSDGRPEVSGPLLMQQKQLSGLMSPPATNHFPPSGAKQHLTRSVVADLLSPMSDLSPNRSVLSTLNTSALELDATFAALATGDSGLAAKGGNWVSDAPQGLKVPQKTAAELTSLAAAAGTAGTTAAAAATAKEKENHLVSLSPNLAPTAAPSTKKGSREAIFDLLESRARCQADNEPMKSAPAARLVRPGAKPFAMGSDRKNRSVIKALKKPVGRPAFE